MASIYCTDCTRQAGDDNWTECYYCGGKNLKKTKKARGKAQAEKERKAQIICSECESFGVTNFLVRPFRRGFLKNISDAFDAMVTFVGKLVGWSLDNECYFCGFKIIIEGEPSHVAAEKARRREYPRHYRIYTKRKGLQVCLLMFGLFGVIVIVNFFPWVSSLVTCEGLLLDGWVSIVSEFIPWC